MSAEDIAAALRFDPLGEAERLTGESYKEDQFTSDLGLLLALEHNARKARLLTDTNDSYFSMDFIPTLDLYANLGFTEVYREEFAGNNENTETYVILWHPDGILATCESYASTSRNSTKVYYNYRHNGVGYPGYGLTSSGSMHGDVWLVTTTPARGSGTTWTPSGPRATSCRRGWSVRSYGS